MLNCVKTVLSKTVLMIYKIKLIKISICALRISYLFPRWQNFQLAVMLYLDIHLKWWKKKFIHFHVYIYHFATYWFICLSTVATWFFEFFTFNIVTEKKAFILGCSESEFINTINYHLKYYIYSSRCKENQLLLTKFQNIWKKVYYIERNIAFRNIWE